MLRYERGLIYTVEAKQAEFSDAGNWFVKTSTSTENLQKVVDIICKELRRVAKNGLGPEEIQFAKNKILTIEAELDLLKRAYAKKPNFTVDEMNWKKVKQIVRKIRKKLFAEVYG